jgi:predicted nucleic acid-binding protein
LVIVFLDASALVYLLESKEPFRSRVHDRLRTLADQHAPLRLAISRLTSLEARVGPMKRNEIDVLRTYDAFFARPDLIWVELSRHVVELATVIRVRHGLRTPDALQAACCLQLGEGHRFMTGDAAFQRVAGLQVEYLNEFAT